MQDVNRKQTIYTSQELYGILAAAVAATSLNVAVISIVVNITAVEGRMSEY